MSLWATVCLLLLSCQGRAAQTDYQRAVTPEGVHYQFSWLDHAGTARLLAFTLRTDSIKHLPLLQQSYSPHLAQREVEISLLKAASEIDPRTARFSLHKHNNGLTFSLTGKDTAQLEVLTQELQDLQATAMANYLANRYYQLYHTPMLQQAIKPHHLRYIEESIQPLVPIAQALYELIAQYSTARTYLNLLLSWVQSIPYDDLTNRVTSNGSGFSPPLALLDENRGDCDSKSVLTAALMRAFMPTSPMRLVLLKDHALLAIAMDAVSQDEVVVLDGVKFVLLDPTGPAPLKLGEVGQQTLLALANRQFTVEEIPAATNALPR